MATLNRLLPFKIAEALQSAVPVYTHTDKPRGTVQVSTIVLETWQQMAESLIGECNGAKAGAKVLEEENAALLRECDEARAAEALAAGALREQQAVPDATGILSQRIAVATTSILSQRIAAVLSDDPPRVDGLAQACRLVAESALTRWQAMAEELEANPWTLVQDPSAEGKATAAERLLADIRPIELRCVTIPRLGEWTGLAIDAVADERALHGAYVAQGFGLDAAKVCITKLEAALEKADERVEETRKWARVEVEKAEAVLAKANATLAERRRDTELLGALEKRCRVRHIVALPSTGGAVMEEIAIYLREGAQRLAFPDRSPQSIRAWLRALVGIEAALEPASQEHPDTARVRKLDAFLQDGKFLQRFRGSSEVKAEGSGFTAVFRPTLADLADALPDPAPQEPEPGEDEKPEEEGWSPCPL